MKKAELEKIKGRAISGRQGPGSSDRFGKGSGSVFDKREQRERDREAGLVPFAVKLHGELVRELHALAQSRTTGLNELTEELIRKGLKAK